MVKSPEQIILQVWAGTYFDFLVWTLIIFVWICTYPVSGAHPGLIRSLARHLLSDAMSIFEVP
jgi:hypothetical protein